MRKTKKYVAKVAGGILLAATLSALVVLAASIDWSMPAARTFRGAVAALVAYVDYLTLSTKHRRPFPFLVEIRDNGTTISVNYMPRQLHFGGAIEYELSRSAAVIRTRRFTE